MSCFSYHALHRWNKLVIGDNKVVPQSTPILFVLHLHRQLTACTDFRWCFVTGVLGQGVSRCPAMQYTVGVAQGFDHLT
jgi:hypothetical protein